MALTLALGYAVGRAGVDIALTGRWSPSTESLAYLVVIPLAQSVVVWWLLGRNRSAA